MRLRRLTRRIGAIFGTVAIGALLGFLVPTVVAVLARVLPRRLPRWLRSTGASVAMLHYAVLSPAVVESCHRADAAVWTWTVNDRAVLEHAVALGVDGVTSDDPRLFLQFSS